MKCGKAVGADEISAEAWKCMGNCGIKILCKLFNSITNTEHFMDFNFGQDNGQGRESVKILGEELQRVHHFKYIGSSVEETGGMTIEITQRVSAAWRNWKRCSGVLCDRRMPVKLKGKVYKTAVRPALLYGAETWATTRGQEARLEVNEMRMLR